MSPSEDINIQEVFFFQLFTWMFAGEVRLPEGHAVAFEALSL